MKSNDVRIQFWADFYIALVRHTGRNFEFAAARRRASELVRIDEKVGCKNGGF